MPLSIALSLSLLLLAPTGSAPAQESAAQEPPPASVTHADTKAELIPLAHASAVDLAGVLAGFRLSGEMIVADARTNSLVVSASTERLEVLRPLVAALDRPVERAEPAPQPPRVAAVPELFAPVRGDLVLGADAESPSLLGLAREYERLTGQSFVIGADVHAVLQNTSAGLGLPIEVRAADVQAFVEHLFAARGFYFLPLAGSSPALIEIVSTRGDDPMRPHSRAQFLDPSQIEAFSRAHPAVPVATVLATSVDARMISNVMRGVFQDRHAYLLPADASTLIAGGNPAVVLLVTRMVQAIDERGEIAPRPTAPPQPAEGK